MASYPATHLEPLMKSFSFVPPASVPAIIECVLASSVLSVSNLFSFLLKSFTDFDEGCQSNFILCYTSALCHLIKKDGSPPDAMNQFISTSFIPLLKVIDPSNSELLNETEELVYHLVFETGSWELLDKTLVPFCVSSVGFGVGTTLKDDMDADKQFAENSSETLGTLPGMIALGVLRSLLDFTLRRWNGFASSERKILNFSNSFVAFIVNLTGQLSNLALWLLNWSAEDRLHAIHLIIPVVLRSLNMLSAFKILEHEPQHLISRAHFLEKMWHSCASLFKLGNLECRDCRDAYRMLSLYFLSFNDSGGDVKLAEINIEEDLDLRGNAIFWEKVQSGLVDRDSSVRKMAIYILKSLINYHYSSLSSRNNQCISNSLELAADAQKVDIILQDRNTSHDGSTKREKWAEKEAKSLGVGKVSHFDGVCLNGLQRWKVFVLLYEMLEEYGTHLVEAAWTHQVSLLFRSFPSKYDQISTTADVYYSQMETLDGMVSWLAVLWERGFFHENPQVRCLIMESFLGIDWSRYENLAQKVPRSFILGPLVRGLNDAVHHKDFGLKGVYMSGTIEGASKYFKSFSCGLSVSECSSLAWSLASVARHESCGRAGLMTLAFCISSTSCHSKANERKEKQCSNGCCEVEFAYSASNNAVHTSAVELLDALRIVISRSKQHYNPNYRLQVCEQILKAASSLIIINDVSLEVFLHFLSAFPREFIDITGPLRHILQTWMAKISYEDRNIGLIDSRIYLLKSLLYFPSCFIRHKLSSDDSVSFDDDDIERWLVEARRWAWVLFLIIRDEQELVPLFEFFKNYCGNLCKDTSTKWVRIKLLILLLCLNEESQIVWKKLLFHRETVAGTEVTMNLDESSIIAALTASEKIAVQLLLLRDEVLYFARLVSPIFWSSSLVKGIELPSSVRGKLGGPTQRRLATPTTTAVLQSIVAMRTIASIASVFPLIKDDTWDLSRTFSWEFVWKAVRFLPCKSETGSELCLATYEALTYVLKTLSASFGLSDFSFLMDYNASELPNGERKPLLDHLILSFLSGINELLSHGLLTRSRQAILMDWKWNCLDSLLSIPRNFFEKGIHIEDGCPFFSDSTLLHALADICESLETGGENSVLSMLRSLRLVLGLLCSGKVGSIVSCHGVNSQRMLQLVRSCWILNLSLNKRRVAPTAALLSAVLHESVFCDLAMHEMNGDKKGPLKWFIENLIDEGTKSPRTMRLSALHLTGLWLLHPKTLKYYIKELKLMSLYGSVAFDEDFEAELSENNEAKMEVSLLAQSPDPELTKVFINTETYARVSVAVLFNKLSQFINRGGKLKKEDSEAALHCGKIFLIELLDSAVNDSDLSKELYKKFSGVHRRKVRAWQMICILSPFAEDDIVEKVTSNLHICLYRNNLPAVRQYLETFAIQIYLRFPKLAEEQLIPIFYDYKMRPQALSSYVFVAANVILHSRELSVQMKHFYNLLPPLIPFLTSHHHSLRCFTQLLVYQVLCKLWPSLRDCKSGFKSLEERCFEDMKLYLAGNVDCMRLRTSMEGFLENFDPLASATPAGVFNSRNKGSEFECVPVSLMDSVMNFLNDVRDELRYSVAIDEKTIKNESLTTNGTSDGIFSLNEASLKQTRNDLTTDFQKKISLKGLEKQPAYDNQSYLTNSKLSTVLSELELEDQLIGSAIQARKEVTEKIRESQQQIILVASLLDRIPNLAGLARTCEVFRAACLAIADSSIMRDKQFQLISVTAEKWIPIIEVPVSSIKAFLEKKRREGFSILGLEQTANSTALDKFVFPKKSVLVLGREKIPVDIIHVLDACVEIPQLGIIRSLNVHVSGAIALWEYTRQQRSIQQ
ncbi:LOW QUALITY PROTEIN: uncharacterized protein LOC110022769 [Phalaenopsis equestris]|uniref:LOW QUALITY PROTEIN: uncharacterized protein LOC110022769 n=1 Tax=Phalaenopsis equestris TaxID=78828 RepID=UPI0009E5C758|nr:LOW QUALITY PROTEIN: uncharacterized protein LOC110022769 [Phalaenopsis equestris]